MCRTFNFRLFLPLILVLCNQLLLSQDTSPSPSRTKLLPDAPSAFTTRADVRFTFGRFALLSEQCQSLNHPSRTIKWCGLCMSVIDLALPERVTFAPAKDVMNRHTTLDSDELEHYVQHIPFAGPMFLRISQDRHISRILRVVQPEF